VVISRKLPSPPTWVNPVKVKDPEVGESSVGVIARERSGRIQNEAKLIRFKDWYLNVKKQY
jgi:hypothetical protein